MNSNPIVRLIQIDLILDKPNVIIDWFDDIWKKFIVIDRFSMTSDVTNRIFYINTNENNDVIFHQDGNFLWCNVPRYWHILSVITEVEYSKAHDITYSDIQAITKFLLEVRYNQKIGIPHEFPTDYRLSEIQKSVDEQIKMNKHHTK